MYLDPDVLFTKKIKFGSILKNSTIYLSDTRSYLGIDYIKSKSPELVGNMASIVGIDPKEILKNDKEAGGAQYIFKNIDYKFWEKVEIDCVNLYEYMNDTKRIYMPHHPIQSWTADMWAVLWNLWSLQRETKIVKLLDFAWATDGYSHLANVNILHNAGIVDQKDCFNKGHYLNASPFFRDYSKMNKIMASYRYVEEIINTQEKYGTLI